MQEFKKGDRVRWDHFGKIVTGVIVAEDSDDGSFAVLLDDQTGGGWSGDQYIKDFPTLDPTKMHLWAFRRDGIELLPETGGVRAAPAGADICPPPKSEAQHRKDRPIVRGCVDYFPDALEDVQGLLQVWQGDTLKGILQGFGRAPTLALITRRDWHQLALYLLVFRQTQLAGDAEVRGSALRDLGAVLAEVANVSRVANEQHHPGAPLHWEYGKSMDHADCLARHFIKWRDVDTDGLVHADKMCWRALAGLQTSLELADADLHASRQARRERIAAGGE